MLGENKTKAVESLFLGEHNDISAFNLLLTWGHLIKLLPTLFQTGCNLSKTVYMEDSHPGHGSKKFISHYPTCGSWQKIYLQPPLTMKSNLYVFNEDFAMSMNFSIT